MGLSGAIQISYNYNYGQFQRWLSKNRIFVDLLKVRDWSGWALTGFNVGRCRTRTW